MATYAPLLTDNATRMVMMKATGDPNTDGNWANVDGHVRFTRITEGVKSLWSFEDSGDIHVATQDTDGDVKYHVFDPGTDTWTTKNEVVVTNDNLTDFQGCSIALRSDGDVIILYTGDNAGDPAVFYARREGTTWTVNQQVDGASGTDNYYGGVAVLGVSDRVHFFYFNRSAVDAFHRSLSSANSLDTADQTVDLTPRTNRFIFGRGVSYVSGATKVRVPYIDSDFRTSVAKLDSGANPTIATDAPASDNTTVAVNETSLACLAVDGTELHLLYSGTDSDIFHDSNDDDAGWGTDVEEKDAVTCNRISCNVYDRSGQKLAYLWLDGTTSKYDEVSLAAATEEEFAATSPFFAQVPPSDDGVVGY